MMVTNKSLSIRLFTGARWQSKSFSSSWYHYYLLIRLKQFLEKLFNDRFFQSRGISFGHVILKQFLLGFKADVFLHDSKLYDFFSKAPKYKAVRRRSFKKFSFFKSNTILKKSHFGLLRQHATRFRTFSNPSVNSFLALSKKFNLIRSVFGIRSNLSKLYVSQRRFRYKRLLYFFYYSSDRFKKRFYRLRIFKRFFKRFFNKKRRWRSHLDVPKRRASSTLNRTLLRPTYRILLPKRRIYPRFKIWKKASKRSKKKRLSFFFSKRDYKTKYLVLRKQSKHTTHILRKYSPRKNSMTVRKFRLFIKFLKKMREKRRKRRRRYHRIWHDFGTYGFHRYVHPNSRRARRKRQRAPIVFRKGYFFIKPFHQYARYYKERPYKIVPRIRALYLRYKTLYRHLHKKSQLLSKSKPKKTSYFNTSLSRFKKKKVKVRGSIRYIKKRARLPKTLKLIKKLERYRIASNNRFVLAFVNVLKRFVTTHSSYLSRRAMASVAKRFKIYFFKKFNSFSARIMKKRSKLFLASTYQARYNANRKFIRFLRKRSSKISYSYRNKSSKFPNKKFFYKNRSKRFYQNNSKFSSFQHRYFNHFGKKKYNNNFSNAKRRFLHTGKAGKFGNNNKPYFNRNQKGSYKPKFYNNNKQSYQRFNSKGPDFSKPSPYHIYQSNKPKPFNNRNYNPRFHNKNKRFRRKPFWHFKNNRYTNRFRRIPSFSDRIVMFTQTSGYAASKFIRYAFYHFISKFVSSQIYLSTKIPVIFNFHFFPLRKAKSTFFLNFITAKLYYRYILSDIVKPIVRMSLKFYRGFVINCNGRFTRAQIAVKKKFFRKPVSFSRVDSPIDYAQKSVVLKYGTCNLRIWIRY